MIRATAACLSLAAPRLVPHGAVLGVGKHLADGTTVSLEGGWQHDRWSASRPGYAVPAGVP